MQRLWEGDRDSVSTKYAAWMKPAWYTAGEPKPQEGHAPNKEPVFSLSSVLLLLVCVKSAQSCPTLRDPMAVARRLLCPWDSSGKNTGVGCPALLQGIVPTPGSNPHPLTSPALVGRFFFITSTTWEALLLFRMEQKWQRFSSSFPTGKSAYFHFSNEYYNRMIT